MQVEIACDHVAKSQLLATGMSYLGIQTTKQSLPMTIGKFEIKMPLGIISNFQNSLHGDGISS